MSNDDDQSIMMVVTDISGSVDTFLKQVHSATIRCERDEESLEFETTNPSDFWVGQKIRVDITFQHRWSQK